MRSGSSVVDRAPPAAPAGRGGGGGGWAWLLTASGIVEAELVRGALETSGVVPVALDTRDPSPGAWMFLSGNVNAPVRVFVPLSLLDAARLALLDAGFAFPGAPEPPPEAYPGRRGGVRRSAVVAAAVLTLLAVAFVIWAIVHAAATCALRTAC